MKAERISLWGLFGQQNLGNECTLETLLHDLRRIRPRAELSAIVSEPEETKARYHIPAYPISRRYAHHGQMTAPRPAERPIRRLVRQLFVRIPAELADWIKAVGHLRSTDLLVVAGTGVLTDAYTGSWGWPYEVFKWSLLARVCRCRLAYLSVGVGPIRERLSGWFIRWALSLADYRSYRDSCSQRCLQSIGFRKRGDGIFPDLVFNHEPAAGATAQCASSGEPVVGVGLMSYAGEFSSQPPGESCYGRYIACMASFVTWLLEHDYSVRMLLGDVRYDTRALCDVRARLAELGTAARPGRLLDEPIGTPEDLVQGIARVDFVVATRFHNVVLALLLAKPVISLSHHDKCEALMADVGLADFSHPIEDISVDRLIEQFSRLSANSGALRLAIAAKTAAYKAALQEQYAVLFVPGRC